MSDNKDHTAFEKDFFEKNAISYSKSKEEVWSDLDAMLDKGTGAKVRKVNFRKMISYSAAAILLLAIGITSFLRFYSIEIVCPQGQHSSIELPDGSKVTLNANSKLSYHPYWWQINRKLNFEGEAFFEVEKGKQFMVVSEKATTSVLGTSFNIYARENDYKVHCITGKVKVETENSQTIVLKKNEYSVLQNKSSLMKKYDEKQSTHSISWINNEFVFNEIPINKIYEEIERQFDIAIEGKEQFNDNLTYSFKRGSSVEDILNSLGLPLGIEFEQITDKRYQLTKP